MKKIILVLGLIFFGTTAFGACDDLQCPEPYDLTSSTSQFFSRITGQRLLSEKIGERILKKTIQKNITKGHVKADITSYSTKDLKAGRFKSATITGKNISVQGIDISYFQARTLCNFNYIAEGKNGNVVIKENMPLEIKIVMTENDINNTMDSSDYKRLINSINNIGGNFNIFNIESADVKIKDNKLHYIVKYSIPFVRKTKEVSLSADLRVQNGQIKLANATLDNKSYSLDVDKFSKILNYINPLDFSTKVLENRDAKFNIQHIDIVDDKVTVEGRVTILKDKE